MFRKLSTLTLALSGLFLNGTSRAQDKQPEAKPPGSSSIESSEILKREPLTQSADVLHVLVGWKELEPGYRGSMDARGKARTREEADKLAAEILEKARAGEDFKALMKQHSEDPGSAGSGQTYTATPDAGLVPPFKNLSLRLKVDEVGVVETKYGWHIIKRVK